MVEAMAGYGMTLAQIASVVESDKKVGISVNTLRDHFKRELECGKTKANAAVAQSLYKKATGSGSSSTTACIFWLKAMAGWKDREPVQRHVVSHIEDMNEEQLLEFLGGEPTPEELGAAARTSKARGSA